MSGESVYEYMGNKRWLQTARQEEAGQTLIPGIDPVRPLDLDSRFTLRPTLDWCKRVAKVEAFDLDVAACAEAHCAPRYYTIDDDGLRQPWNAPHVWCNPPYSDIGPWVARAWEQMRAGACELVAMLLPATRSEQPWWQDMVEPFRDRRKRGIRLTTHYLPGRQNFGIPGNPLGVGVGSPPFPVVMLLWSRSARGEVAS